MQECVETTGVRDSVRRLQHRVARHVCDIDQHAEPVELRDRRAPERAQTAVFRFGVAEILARIAGVGQCVVTVVREREIASAQRTEARQPRQIGAGGEAVLHRRHDGKHAVALRRLDLRRGDRDAGVDATLAAPHGADREQHRQRALAGRRLTFRGSGDLRHVGGEAAGCQPAALHLRQIDAPRAILERVGAGRPGDVDVGIECQQPAMQGETCRIVLRRS